MWGDSQFIQTIQLSFIGIIIVLGLYAIWKQIHRTEVRLIALSEQTAMAHEAILNFLARSVPPLHHGHGSNGQNGQHDHKQHGHTSYADHEFEGQDQDVIIGPEQLMAEMKHLFGQSMFAEEAQNTGVHIVEYPDESSTPGPVPAHVHVHVNVNENQGSSSTVETDAAPVNSKVPIHINEDVDDVLDVLSDDTAKTLSKSKLHKMSVEALRELLASRSLATDGTKKELIARLTT